MRILYELLIGAYLHFAAWQYSRRRYIEPSLHFLCSQIVHQQPWRKQNECISPDGKRIAATGA